MRKLDQKFSVLHFLINFKTLYRSILPPRAQWADFYAPRPPAFFTQAFFANKLLRNNLHFETRGYIKALRIDVRINLTNILMSA